MSNLTSICGFIKIRSEEFGKFKEEETALIAEQFPLTFTYKEVQIHTSKYLLISVTDLIKSGENDQNFVEEQLFQMIQKIPFLNITVYVDYNYLGIFEYNFYNYDHYVDFLMRKLSPEDIVQKNIDKR